MNRLPGDIGPRQGLVFSFVGCSIVQRGGCEPSLLVLYGYVNKSMGDVLSYSRCKSGSALVSWLLIRLAGLNRVHFRLAAGMLMMESASDLVVNSVETIRQANLFKNLTNHTDLFWIESSAPQTP